MRDTINPEEMRSRLLTLDEAKARIAPTEGLAEYEFKTDGSDRVLFEFPDNWNVDLAALADFDTTSAVVSIRGQEIPLTKIGALDIASTVGLSKAYTADTPGNLVEPHLNYHYSHGARGQKKLKLLAGNNGGLAITRGTVTPFSNTALLDAVCDAIQEKYGEQDLMLDYKLNNTLDKSNLRVIVPSHQHTIDGSKRAEQLGSDPWSVGIEIANSITGNGSLELSGYLFAWWCTNGQTIEHVSSGKYRRKPSLTPEAAYSWSRGIVDDVLNDLEREFATIEALTQINLEDDLDETVRQAFNRFEIPEDSRGDILNSLVATDDLTAYGLLNAITQAANDNTNGNQVNALLRAGGNFARVMHEERCPTCHKF